MGDIGAYVIRILIAAMICGIVLKLPGGKGSSSVMVKLIGGVFLAVTVLDPVMDITLTDLMQPSIGFSAQADFAVEEGVGMARSALRESMISRMEAYIQDKAMELGTCITVEIRVSEDDIPVPTSAFISGQVSPYSKRRLTSIIEDDLGIRKEDQTWT